MRYCVRFLWVWATSSGIGVSWDSRERRHIQILNYDPVLKSDDFIFRLVACRIIAFHFQNRWDTHTHTSHHPLHRDPSSSHVTVLFLVSFHSLIRFSFRLLSRGAAEVLTGSFAGFFRTSKCVWHVHSGKAHTGRDLRTGFIKAPRGTTLLTFKGSSHFADSFATALN